MSYRTQLRATLYRIYGRHINEKPFRITESQSERTLGLDVPIDGNLHMQHWLWHYGWKVVQYNSYVVVRNIPFTGATKSGNATLGVPAQFGAVLHLEVRKLEEIDKEFKTHPRNKKTPSPHGTLPKEG